MSGQVVGSHYTAVGRCVRFELGRQFPSVKSFAVGCGDLLEGGRMIGKGEPFSGFRCPPAGHERFGEPGLRLEQRHLHSPLLGHGG